MPVKTLPSGHKLGANFSDDPRDIKLEDIVDIEAVQDRLTKQAETPLKAIEGDLPSSFGDDTGVMPGNDWGILGNGPGDTTIRPDWKAARKDGAGCCVWSMKTNRIRISSRMLGLPIPPFSGDSAINGYRSTGYDPITGTGDDGTDIRESLKWEMTNGFEDLTGTKHELGGFAAIDATNPVHRAVANYVFGAVDLGINFYACFMDEFNANLPWSIVKKSPIEGGHGIPQVARRVIKGPEIISWGRDFLMLDTALEKACTQAFATVRNEWITGELQPRFGLDVAKLAKLQKELAAK